MSEAPQNARLNEVLIHILRGLLQYSAECWPWSRADEEQERNAIQRMVAEQQAEVQQLCDLLNEREYPIDFGTYPTQYTDLHYVSLDYLLDNLVNEQAQLVQDVQQAVTDCSGDPQAVELLQLIQPRVKTHLEQLKELAAARTAGSSA